MLFRYKITMCGYDAFAKVYHGYAIRYYVEIQYFNQDAKIFKWKKFADQRLCCILDALGHDEEEMYLMQDFEDVLKQYKDIDEIMSKYIQKEIKDRDMESKHNQHEDEIDNFVVTNGWNTIEIKENE